MKMSVVSCNRFGFVVLVLLAGRVVAAPQNPAANNMSVVQAGGDSKTWQDGSGHQFLEIATGMNYFDTVNKQWRKSDPSFAVAPDGSFAANHLQRQVSLAPNLNAAGAVTAITSDGITLNLHRLASGFTTPPVASPLPLQL